MKPIGAESAIPDAIDSTISVSKGCFVFKNGATRMSSSAASKTVNVSPSKRRCKTVSEHNYSPLEHHTTGQAFFNVYTTIWRRLSAEIEKLHSENYSNTLEDLMNYVINGGSQAEKSTEENEAEEEPSIVDSLDNEILPTAVLLTGINQMDHLHQFVTLAANLRTSYSANVCMLLSRDCGSLKTAIETLVYNFVEVSNDNDRDHKRLRRSSCTISLLKRWYTKTYSNNENTNGSSPQRSHKRKQNLVLILPDFECFPSHVLQDLILILSSLRSELPFTLVLGVATNAVAVHAYLPYHVTSKIKVRMFKTQSASEALNEILERVLLSPRNIFHLSGKTLQFLTHIFLYYDFSINGFIQGYKYCLMEHYFQGNAYALCTTYAASLKNIPLLDHNDLETIRRLLSFRPYVEAINDCQRVISILTDDNYLKRKLPSMLNACHVHFLVRHIILEFLYELVRDLPKCPLGNLRRELYAISWTKEITAQAEFRECWKLLALLSKEEFVAKMNRAINNTLEYIVNELKGLELTTDCVLIVNEKIVNMKKQLDSIQNASNIPIRAGVSNPEEHQNINSLKDIGSRHQLKERLLQMQKIDRRPVSEFAQLVTVLLEYIETKIVHPHLPPFQRAPPLHELFVFSDITAVRRNIIGAPRAALHVALNNPHFYLQCKCCDLDNEQQRILPTLPDISVAYKLHLECGRMINLFDWMQAFRSVLTTADETDETTGAQDQIDPQIQARFTRAIAELQYCGYIKMSKRKMDHATRLTW